MFAHLDIDEYEAFNKAYTFDALNKFCAAILLITSILVLRRKFNSKEAQKVFAKEKKIVLVHLVIFLLICIFLATFLAVNCIRIPVDIDTVQFCRLSSAAIYIYFFVDTSNIVQIILFTFMSVKLSQPLTGFWVEFLLRYKS